MTAGSLGCMKSEKPEPAELFSVKDLKPLLAIPGPCLSLYLPLSTAPNQQGLKLNTLEWKELITSAQSKAGDQGDKLRTLLKSVENIEELTDGAPGWAKSIAVLRAEDL